MTPSTLLVDSSVAVKWLVPEVDSDSALALLAAHLLAPDLLGAECANVLWKKVRRGELTGAEGSLALAALGRAQIDIVPTWPLLDDALNWAVALGHPAYDCCYLALAERSGAVLVTADRRLLARLRGSVLASRAVALSDWRPAPL